VEEHPKVWEEIHTYTDTQAIHSQISDPQDPFPIRDDRDFGLLLRPIANKAPHIALQDSAVQ